MNMTTKKENAALVLFRNDLRIIDNQALDHARKNHSVIHAVFIFDINAQAHVPSEKKIGWIKKNLRTLQKELKKIKIALTVEEGDSISIVKTKIKSLDLVHIYANISIDPVTRTIDEKIQNHCNKNNIYFSLFHSNTFLPLNKIKNKSGNPYKRYSSFKNTYLSIITEPAFYDLIILPTIKTTIPTEKQKPGFLGAMEQLEAFVLHTLNTYNVSRNFPAIKGTSKLSLYLAIGVISPKIIIKRLFSIKLKKNKALLTFIQELIWREFCHYTLFHFPEAIKKPLQKSINLQ